MSRTLFIHGSLRGDDHSSFPLRVPSLDVTSTDLVACVRDRLAIPAGARFYFAYEPPLGSAPSEEAVPLSAALPDGTRLRLVMLGQAFPREEARAAAANGALLEESPSQARRRPCCLEEANELPSPKEMTTDLANERTVLAWIRTALAVIRTVFSFATLNGLTKSGLVIDIAVTILLSVSAVASLFVGYQRFLVVRRMGITTVRRLSIRPLMVVFIVVSGVCCAVTLVKQPKRLHSTMAYEDM